MEFKYSYKFTEKAEKNLDEILAYIKEELFNPSAASAFLKKVFENIDNIRNFPLSGMIVENDFLLNKEIRRIVLNNYIIYYLTNEKTREITIIRIVYGKRNLEDIYRAITE